MFVAANIKSIIAGKIINAIAAIILLINFPHAFLCSHEISKIKMNNDNQHYNTLIILL